MARQGDIPADQDVPSVAQGNLANTALQPGDLGTTVGKIPVVPVPMSAMSFPVKATIDRITSNADSAAYYSASDFATSTQGSKADSALQSEDINPEGFPISTATQSALDGKIDLETALEMLATQQANYDVLNGRFLSLLKWVITTFGQIPEGLEDQLEEAIGV